MLDNRPKPKTFLFSLGNVGRGMTPAVHVWEEKNYDRDPNEPPTEVLLNLKVEVNIHSAVKNYMGHSRLLWRATGLFSRSPDNPDLGYIRDAEPEDVWLPCTEAANLLSESCFVIRRATSPGHPVPSKFFSWWNATEKKFYITSAPDQKQMSPLSPSSLPVKDFSFVVYPSSNFDAKALEFTRRK